MEGEVVVVWCVEVGCFEEWGSYSYLLVVGGGIEGVYLFVVVKLVVLENFWWVVGL